MRSDGIPTVLDFCGNVALIVIAGLLVLRERRRAAPVDPTYDTIVMQVHLARVFVVRIWLGRALMRFAMWVIGGRAEVLPLDES
jgi:hypothetical protein